MWSLAVWFSEMRQCGSCNSLAKFSCECQGAVYCSKECQSNDFAAHKEVCYMFAGQKRDFTEDEFTDEQQDLVDRWMERTVGEVYIDMLQLAGQLRLDRLSRGAISPLARAYAGPSQERFWELFASIVLGIPKATLEFRKGTVFSFLLELFSVLKDATFKLTSISPSGEIESSTRLIQPIVNRNVMTTIGSILIRDHVQASTGTFEFGKPPKVASFSLQQFDFGFRQPEPTPKEMGQCFDSPLGRRQLTVGIPAMSTLSTMQRTIDSSNAPFSVLPQNFDANEIARFVSFSAEYIDASGMSGQMDVLSNAILVCTDFSFQWEALTPKVLMFLLG